MFNRILERVNERRRPISSTRWCCARRASRILAVNIGHFGLNLRKYAHFTSPIRRYADLIVHRGLITALGLGSDGLPNGIEETLPGIAEAISGAERRGHAGRTRDHRPADRPVAADRVGAIFNGAFPASPRRACSSASTRPAPMLHSDLRRLAPTIRL